MRISPRVIVFDVNETLSDMRPLIARFVAVGAPAHLAQVWFAGVLRDGFALAAAGGSERFGVIGADLLRRALRAETLMTTLDDAVSHIMLGLTGLELHPDVAGGVRALRRAGHTLVTLSNGAASLAEGLVERAGLRTEFQALLSVEDAGVWKPARGAYDYAARVAGFRPEEAMLVAVHPWDIHGAAAAGLSTAWLNRTGEAYPSYFTAPDLTIHALGDLATALGAPPTS